MATHKISWASPPGPVSTSRTEYFDDQLGLCTAPWNKPIREPFELALGNGKMNQDAYDELMQSPEGGETFADTLPYVQKAPPKTLSYSNYKQYPAVLPDPQEDVLYNVRQFISAGRYRTFIPCPYDPFWWNVMGVTEWKKVTESASYSVPNPEYDIYLQKRAQFKAIVAATFIPYGNYQFPGLPLIEGYKWYYDDVEILQDSEHPLANSDGGWKFIMKSLPSTMWDNKFEQAVSAGIFLPAPYNLKAILSI